MNLVSLLSTASLVATDAETIIPAVEFFVKEAETAGGAGATTTGAQKLAAVKAALQAYITTNFPRLVDTFDAIWTSMTGVINGLVALYNSLGVFTHAVAAG
ncbi:hypothetical protein [Caulobacter sp. S45]|uniref:hypothetical protein n=1 Tax=Caulobacter sp. S45 TaxID=1641861 RepID=UPI001576B9AB|nr:hypothetical protein [Caulobacter sp. S45]